jgi:glycosyltransferase involved in cell wall biosynthesis
MIPAYNEEKSITKVIKKIPRKFEGIDKVDVLVINDGSTDGTEEVAKKYGADYVESHVKNQGVGKAFSTGISKALELDADFIVNIDADGQFNPVDIPKLLEPIIKDEADFVTATRFLKKENIPEMPMVKKFGNYAVTFMVNRITGMKFTDTQCGFRAFSKKAALKLNLFGKFTYTQEVFLDLVNKDILIKEIPLKIKYHKERVSKVVKNPVNYGLNVLIIILNYIKDTRPLLFFGSFGSFIFLSGLANGSWLFVRWLSTGKVSPYKSLVTLSGVLLILGFLLIFLALIADVLGRQRKILEEILYYNKLMVYHKKFKKND